MRRIVTAVLTLSLAFSFLLATTETANANAIAGGGYSSSYAGESVFTNKAAGETGQFSAIFFNDGTQTWSAGVVGLLICLSDKTTCNVASPNAAYASGWFSSTVYATVSATTAPGQNGFFIYNFTVPAGTAPSTVATFNGDVGLIATGTELRPEGYFQVNTTPAVSGAALTISPTSAALPVGGQQQFTVTGAPAGSTTTFAVNGGCGAVTTGGLFAATATNSPTQPCSVVASAGGLTATASITVFGAAATLACSAAKTTIVSSTSSSDAIKATLLDTNGNVVANNSSDTIRFTNNTPSLLVWSSTTPDEGGVNGQTSTNTNRDRIAQSGVAQANVLPTGTTGTGVVSATDQTNTSVTGCSQSITITAPGATASLSPSFSLGTIAANGTSTSVLEVDALDASGAFNSADSSTVVSISRNSGASSCGIAVATSGIDGGTAGSAQATLASGSAFFTVASTTTPGTCSWTATANVSGVSSGSATLTTVLVGAANQIKVTGTTSPKQADGVATMSITAALLDAAGNPVTGDHKLTSGNDTIKAKLETNCTGTKADGTTGNVIIAATATRGTGGTGLTVATAGGSFTTSSGATTASGSGGSVSQSTGIFAPNTSSGTGSTNLVIFKLLSTFATTCTVTLSDTTNTNVTSTSADVQFTPGGVATVACLFAPKRVLNDGASTSVSTVSLVDSQNNLATAGTYSIAFSRTSSVDNSNVTTSTANTTLLTSSPQNSANGVATFTVKSTTNTGTDTYTATVTISGNSKTSTCNIGVGTTL